MDPHAAQGQSFVGKIKSYSSTKGYGFIVSDSINQDLFFYHKNLAKDVANRAQWTLRLKDRDVSFTCEETPEGKPGAVDVQILDELEEEEDIDFGGKKGKKGKGKGWGWGFGAWGYMPFGFKGFAMKGKGKGKGGKNSEFLQAGTPVLEERIQAQMKSYSNGSKWGFATADPSAGDVGDIFVHMNNMDESTPEEVNLREGDIIELDLVEINGKTVAKNITIVPQEASVYVSQFVKGKITAFDEASGTGGISSARIDGDVMFSREDCAGSMDGNFMDVEVMFRIITGADGKAKAAMVNPLWGLDHTEGPARAMEVIETLHADGYIDETAIKALSATDPNEMLNILPDLDLAKADNPSSFILGALSRQRWTEMQNMWNWQMTWGCGSKGPY